MQEGRKFKVALIGTGAISGIYLKNLVHEFSITEVVGCADEISARSKERADEFSIRQMAVDEIFQDREIDIVVNTTSPRSHYDITKAALKADKHVYSEKMMAVSFEEGKELLGLANERGLLYTVAPDTFLGAGAQTVRKLIEAGFIGEPVHVIGICQRGYHLNGSSPSESHLFDAGGGIPFDMGGYYLHTMIHLFGPVKRVTGFARARSPVRTYMNPRHPKYKDSRMIDTLNDLTASIEFRNGVYGTLVITSESINGHAGMQMMGTQGTVMMHDPNDFGGIVQIKRQDNVSHDLPMLYGYAKNSRGIGVADMAYALKNHRKPRVSADIGLHALEMIHGIWKASESGLVYEMETTCKQPKALAQGNFDAAQECVLDD